MVEKRDALEAELTTLEAAQSGRRV
jgi:hypothetical protein